MAFWIKFDSARSSTSAQMLTRAPPVGASFRNLTWWFLQHSCATWNTSHEPVAEPSDVLKSDSSMLSHLATAASVAATLALWAACEPGLAAATWA